MIDYAGLHALGAFEGDTAEALRALHAHLRRDWPETGLALLHVDGLPPTHCRLAGLIGVDGVELLPALDPFGRRGRLPTFGDPLVARLLQPAQPHALVLDPSERALPLAQALAGPAAVIALPMPGRGRVEHWLLLTASAPAHVAHAEPRSVALAAALAYTLLARPLALRQLERESRRHVAAIEGLADIQRLLQPGELAIRGLAHAVHWQPAETAAGDYWDLMSLSHAIDDFVDTGLDAWGMMLGDVSGHGAAAAMEAVQFDAILRTYQVEVEPGGPAGALTYANRHFFSRRQRRHFLTLFTAACRPDQDRLAYVCAGHPPALHRRGTDVRWLGRDQDAGIPLGILREHRWDNTHIDFPPGDVLVAYTDGIIEARDRHGRMFGTERLERLVIDGDDAPEAIKARILEALFEHQDATVGTDDQTLIVLRRNGDGR